jgi:acetyl esterase/lipase
MRQPIRTLLFALLSAGFILPIYIRAESPPPVLEMELWPDGPAEENGLSGPEGKGGCVGNISKAMLTIYSPPADKANGTAVVITPGGGYGVVCLQSEGKAIAEILNRKGITAAVVKYRLPNKHYEIPSTDVRRAIRTVRHHAKAWGINPKRIGVWGFSAGGHLASTVATVFDAGKPDAEEALERQSSRPDFAILFYPVISMEAGVTHGGTRNNLIGPDAGKELLERFSNENRVSKDTPPTFMLHCSDDRVVRVENSLRFYRNLIAHKVPAELLIFEKGSHGPGAFKNNPSWEGAFDRWLTRHVTR